MAHPRRQWHFRGVPTAFHCAPTEFWPAIHCMVTERSWFAHGVQRVVTAHRRRAHSVHGVPNAFLRRLHGVYTSILEKPLQAYCRNRRAYKRELTDVIYCLIFVFVDKWLHFIVIIYVFYLCIHYLFIYLFSCHYFHVITFNAGEDGHIMAMMLAISEIIQWYSLDCYN